MMKDTDKRLRILLKDFAKLNEENQYILLSECHDLLKAQELKEKHLENNIIKLDNSFTE